MTQYRMAGLIIKEILEEKKMKKKIPKDGTHREMKGLQGERKGKPFRMQSNELMNQSINNNSE